MKRSVASLLFLPSLTQSFVPHLSRPLFLSFICRPSLASTHLMIQKTCDLDTSWIFPYTLVQQLTPWHETIFTNKYWFIHFYFSSFLWRGTTVTTWHFMRVIAVLFADVIAFCCCLFSDRLSKYTPLIFLLSSVRYHEFYELSHLFILSHHLP